MKSSVSLAAVTVFEDSTGSCLHPLEHCTLGMLYISKPPDIKVSCSSPSIRGQQITTPFVESASLKYRLFYIPTGKLLYTHALTENVNTDHKSSELHRKSDNVPLYRILHMHVCPEFCDPCSGKYLESTNTTSCPNPLLLTWPASFINWNHLWLSTPRTKRHKIMAIEGFILL